MFTYLRKLFQPERIDFARLIADGAVILDVRTGAEFAAGHLKSARNIPLDQLGSKVEELKRLHKPLITVCRSGGRSASAKEYLEKMGLEVYNGGPWPNLKHLA